MSDEDVDELLRFWLEESVHRRSSGLPYLCEEVKKLRRILRNLLEHYVGLVKSGDAGKWDPESEPSVRAARAVLYDGPIKIKLPERWGGESR